MDLRETLPLAIRHPWETVRFEFFFETLVARDVLARATVLDVGAGDAWFSGQLVTRAPEVQVTCWDTEYGPEQLRSAAPPGLQLTIARPDAAYDVVLLLDVLEHIEDDLGFLTATVETNLARGGHALVSVPAWPMLFSAHDEMLHHVRRYRPSEGRALLERAGLTVLRSGGLFHSLAPLRGLQIIRDRIAGSRARPPTGAQWHRGRALTSLLDALTLDTTTSRYLAALGVELPGLTWWALCRR